MGKKNKNLPNLGRSLIKDRFGNSAGRKFVGHDSMLHTTEIQDGYDWGRLNLQSVTEESSFQEFLSTAELAGTEFQAEKLNIKFVNPRSNVGLLTKEEKEKAATEFEKNKELIKIPRRPPWNSQTSPEQLQQNERDIFLEWRRSLSVLQEEKGVLLTPYEKNLEFWRQLWRVVEKSDLIVQIVDARNPLLFRCEDLEKYVKEVSEAKENIILINKADFLNEQQREFWANYFSALRVHVAFFSAVSIPAADSKETEIQDSLDEHLMEDKLSFEDVKHEVEKLNHSVDATAEALASVLKNIDNAVKEITDGVNQDLFLNRDTETADNKKVTCKSEPLDDSFDKLENSSELLTREKLINFLKKFHTGTKVTPNVTTIGLVGYPNVGKSSTINALITEKKVSVSATPGKTKHFQTIYLDKDVLLCDCPGLVMPSFVFTKAEMIVNGILPIDQMRDHVPPINLVCNLIPRHVLEDKYGIMLPKPMEGEDETRCPTAEELLNAYAYNRGFMTANGQPDNPRAARYILKDFMTGKLLYPHAPPDVDQENYHPWPEKLRTTSEKRVGTPREIRAIKPNRQTAEELDKVFFRSLGPGVHVKGFIGKPGTVSGTASLSDSMSSLNAEKPWKKMHKHENKKKKEKLRRLYAHLDQH